MSRGLRNILNLMVTPRGKDLGILLIRVAAGALMLTHGIQKAMNYSILAETFADPIGIGAKASFILIMLTETVGSILLILGLFTRPAALALMIGMVVAAFVVHSPFTIGGSELPLLYLVVSTGLLLTGGGRYSADYVIERYLSASKKR